MIDRHERFQVGAHPRVQVSNSSGSIAVLSGEVDVVDVTIDASGDKYTIEQVGDTIIVRPNSGFMKRMFSGDIVVLVPPGSDLDVRSASGEVTIEADAGEVSVATASGDLRARTITGAARVKVASGDVLVDHVGGSLDLVSASGDVRVRSVSGDISIKTASGDVNIERVGGSAELTTASGDLKVGRVDGGEIAARTLSGDVTVGIPPRRRVEIDMQSMSGDLRNRLPEGDGSPPEKTIQIRANSVSGDVTIQGA